MSERPLGSYIHEIAFCAGGFGIGYMVGNQLPLGEWGWLVCGLLGFIAGGSVHIWLKDDN